MSILKRVAQLAIAGALAVLATACTCPDPITLDQFFLLDATPGDGGGPADGGGLADGGSYEPPPLDCTGMAANCVPGEGCRPACDCVLARAHISYVGVVSCTLLAGAGQPEVEVRYQRAVFCGGD